MAGPIQTALGQALGAFAGAAALGKKLANDEKQADERQIKQEKKAAQIEAEESKEAAAVATEADLINLGASEEAAKAFRLAQERGTGKPDRILFDEKGKAIATYNEVASLLSKQSLENSYSARLRSKNSMKIRRQLLEGKTHQERVQNAVLATKGGK